MNLHHDLTDHDLTDHADHAEPFNGHRPGESGQCDRGCDDQLSERVPARWLIDRDLDAVAAHLDAWILAAEPDHDSQTTALPLLGTPAWIAADPTTRNASVALYVLACLAEREPVVIAARLAAEIAAGRTAHLAAMRQASHAISTAIPTSGSAYRTSSTSQGGTT